MAARAVSSTINRACVLLLLAAGAAPAAAPAAAQVQGEAAALHAAPAQDAAARMEAMRVRVAPYVERHRTDPAWITSRLQMYWQGRHTDVYVKDSLYHHAEGSAPVPTVRFTGGRDSATAYATPALEEVRPFMGEGDLLYLRHKESGQWELVPQAKTGRIVEAINLRIASLARDAALVYQATGDEQYARFAADIFDTYVTGLAYRNKPVDLNHAHDGTIVGLQSYEVIHEDIVGPLAETRELLGDWLRNSRPGKIALHDTAFRRWADVILENGVPWNNWNLIKARFVLHIAATLGNDAAYPDGKGRGHYVRAVIDGSGPRQWGLRQLLEHGYDPATGIWNESPAYSLNVLEDYLEVLELLERVDGRDLLPAMPVLPRAAAALPQYLLPNGRMAGFGDSRYDTLRSKAVQMLLAHAERHGDVAAAGRHGRLLAALRDAGSAEGKVEEDAHAQPAVPVTDYQTPTFFAPNVSWLIQRNGYTGGKPGALAISQAGSTGNHAHANGIAMELFALGVSLAPESGRGSGYLQNDHLQYYAQFPAHNTVLVDGMSTYPSMKADHPLLLNGLYPASGSTLAGAFPWVTYSDVSFVEPATQSDQRRVMGTVRLADGTAYVVDVFRSRRRNGKDKYHDYIYHNLGQSMAFAGNDGKVLPTAPSGRLSFADGDVFGYDFWRDRQSLVSTAPLTARFDLALPGRQVRMHAWLQGVAGREFFSVQAPPSTAWVPGVLPAGIDKLPLQTLVVRQRGEAWSHPFSAVFEAVEGGGAGQVQGVAETVGPDGALALRVSTRGGGRQAILSTSGTDGSYAGGGQRLRGRYGIVAQQGDAIDYLFLGDGREIAAGGYALRSGAATSAALWQQGGRWLVTAGAPVRLTVPAAWPATLALQVNGRSLNIPGRLQGRVRTYALPALPPTPIR
jgi:hypothetical protein